MVAAVECAKEKCTFPYECSNSTIELVGSRDEVHALGYKSNYGDGASIYSTTIVCRGAFSCHDTYQILASDLKCSGLNSCSNVESLTSNPSEIWCLGTGSCSNSFIQAHGYNNVLECWSDSSCADSFINNTMLIYGRGAYSIKNSFIWNTIADTIYYVSLVGYHAGFNSSIYCEANKNISCIISCYSSGCYGVRLICITSKTQNQNENHKNDTDADEIKNDVGDGSCNQYRVFCSQKDNDNCPIYQWFESIPDGTEYINNNHKDSDSDLNSNNRENHERNEILVTFDAFTLTSLEIAEIENDKCDELSSVGSKFVYDSYREFVDDSIMLNKSELIDYDYDYRWDNICCRGTESCSNSSIISINSDSGNIICSGSMSCANSGIIELLSHNSSLYCFGGGSCARSTIIGPLLSTKGNDAYMNSTVYCSGSISCDFSTISNVNNVFCTGSYFDCFNTTLYNVQNIYILTKQLVPAGSSMTIYSNGIRNMTVFFGGYAASDGTIIYCNKGDICNFICDTNDACFEDTTKICCKSGMCNIICNDHNGDCLHLLETPECIADQDIKTEDLMIEIIKMRDITVYSAIGMLLCLIVISLLHSVMFSHNIADSINYVSIGKYFASIIDTFTDILFAMLLYFSENTKDFKLSIVCAFFVIVPYLISCVTGLYWINVWKHRNNYKNTKQQRGVTLDYSSGTPTTQSINASSCGSGSGSGVNPSNTSSMIVTNINAINTINTISNSQSYTNRLEQYLSKYEYILIISMLFGGFYSTIDLFESKLFYLNIFCIPLKKREFIQSNTIQYTRFFNRIIMENLAQFIVQIVYIINHNDDNSNERESSSFWIVFWTMVFTIISLLFGLLRVLVILTHQLCFTKKFESKAIIDGSFCIEHRNLAKYHKFCHKKLGTCFETVLNSTNNAALWNDNNNVYYNIEIYLIEDYLLLKQLKIYYEIQLHSLNASNTAIICNSMRQSIDSMLFLLSGSSKNLKNSSSSNYNINQTNKMFVNAIKNTLRLQSSAKMVKLTNISQIRIVDNRSRDLNDSPDSTAVKSSISVCCVSFFGIRLFLGFLLSCFYF